MQILLVTHFHTFLLVFFVLFKMKVTTWVKGSKTNVWYVTFTLFMVEILLQFAFYWSIKRIWLLTRENVNWDGGTYFRRTQAMNSNVCSISREWLVGFLTVILSIWSILPAHLRRSLTIFLGNHDASSTLCFLKKLPKCFAGAFKKILGSFNARKWRWK